MLTVIVRVVYVIMGFVQFFAIMEGTQTWWGWHWFLSGIVALFIAGIPILGTITGIMGAIKGWDWPTTAAILLFCWPYVLYAIFLFLPRKFQLD
jgi:hypothetical protein